MLQIVLATGNKHKVEEINQVSVPFGVEFVLPDEGFNPIEDGWSLHRLSKRRTRS